MSSLLNLPRNASVRVVNWPTALKSPAAKRILNKAVKRKLLEQPIRQVNDHIFAKFLPTKASHLNHYQSPSTKSKSLENSSSGMTRSICYLLSLAKRHNENKGTGVRSGCGPGSRYCHCEFHIPQASLASCENVKNFTECTGLLWGLNKSICTNTLQIVKSSIHKKRF